MEGLNSKFGTVMKMAQRRGFEIFNFVVCPNFVCIVSSVIWNVLYV